MCVAPRTFDIERDVDLYEEITVSCGECWQCRLTKVNDLVGRCLAEAYSSDHVAMVTLTYRDGIEGSPEKYLHKEHFQKFIRALRDRHHRLRYLCVSERGSKGTERLHFHALLFFRGSAPQWSGRDERIWCDTWPWGHMNCNWNADDSSARYVCKYILKNSDQSSYWKTSSLKPALGHDWFMLKADQAIEHGVMPTSFLYLPPNARGGIRYRMSGATRRNYIHRIVEGLRQQDRCPWSISGEHVQRAVDLADRWAIDREERQAFLAMTDEQRTEYFRREAKHMLSKYPDLVTRSAESLGNQDQIERARSELWHEQWLVDTFYGAASDFEQMSIDMERNRDSWSEPYEVGF